jgi:hypothetical protein
MQALSDAGISVTAIGKVVARNAPKVLLRQRDGETVPMPLFVKGRTHPPTVAGDLENLRDFHANVQSGGRMRQSADRDDVHARFGDGFHRL